jgi:general secretion pathway protein F
VVGGGVSLFLTTYVVPRFAQVYQGSGRNLPWMTEALLGWGRFAAEHTGFLLSLLGLAVVGGVLAMRWVLGRVGWVGVLSQLPGIGQRLRVYELSRLYLTLGMLNEGGIPVVASLDIASQMLPASMRESVQASKAMIESGMPLSAAFEAHGLTTSISVRLLRVGERTGNLGHLLTQSALFYDGEISRWIDRFTRAFEPLLMAAIGIVVGVIVVLLYMPIFDLAGGL